MMRMKTKPTVLSPATGPPGAAEGEWEVRPGGMLVQKRTDADQNRPPPPTIRVRVKYGSVYHEVNINSQATFGELKKMLSGPTGLHHEDQKLMFKDKERDNKTFLDIVGVKDRSKMVVVEDPISQEKRYIEMRKNAKMELASKSISQISLEVDRLGGQVSALESVISKGGIVPEKNVLNLIELLMNQLLKLDGIVGEGDVKLQRKMQVRRVQKYVETLDVLKVKNSVPTTVETPTTPQKHTPFQEHGRYTNGQEHERHSIGHSPVQAPRGPPQEPPRHSSSGPVVITTQWETFEFDSMPSASARAPATTNPAPATTNPVPAKFNWDLL